ncbi:SMP-30/gluconolactonase/LRE family protein [Marinococcus halophilus]|uniref:SMP-30/gluconolactonase/LRE family protein n=1 Tax=Marinococcus halophilus TaxID=1371 RepID=UPI0009A57E49|nr:SMP-30/gluconolactonase/LRE family protein [Marinococcus halophilus]
MREASLVIDQKAELGEGPSWDAQRGVLYWVDIDGFKLMEYHPSSGRHYERKLDQHVCAAVPREKGGMMLALRDGFYSYDLVSGEKEAIIDPEPDKPGNRFNDGKCDPSGRFWAGTMAVGRGTGEAALYRLNKDMSLDTVFDSVTISNGLAWTEDGSMMYYIDTPTKKVMAYDLDAGSGEITGKRTAITFQEGSPDGMCMDQEGMLWIALHRLGKVERWNPQTSERLETVTVPAQRTTSCVFGGEDLKDLYITTARGELSEEDLRKEPHAGGLFHIRTDVPGTPTYTFGG